MIKGMHNLSKIVQSPGQFSPRDFEKKMEDFGDALKQYDNFDGGENTIFALFDKLIHRDSAEERKRNSSLTLTSRLNGHKATKMLFS